MGKIYKAKDVFIGDQIQTQSYNIKDPDLIILARIVSIHHDGIYANVESVLDYPYPSEIFRSWGEFEKVSLKA